MVTSSLTIEIKLELLEMQLREENGKVEEKKGLTKELIVLVRRGKMCRPKNEVGKI